jgi:hypothetical protein
VPARLFWKSLASAVLAACDQIGEISRNQQHSIKTVRNNRDTFAAPSDQLVGRKLAPNSNPQASYTPASPYSSLPSELKESEAVLILHDLPQLQTVKALVVRTSPCDANRHVLNFCNLLGCTSLIPTHTCPRLGTGTDNEPAPCRSMCLLCVGHCENSLTQTRPRNKARVECAA